MRVDDEEIHIFQFLEEQADTIDDCIENRRNQFRLAQRCLFEHTSIDPKYLTIYGCIARVSAITKLLPRLRISRRSSKVLWALYKNLEDVALKYQHPTLLDRLDRDIKLKIKRFSVSAKREELDVYSYKLRLHLT
ncbi:hypothetical protein CEXT_637201 [Caerostris extrusa]|uniref:Uncharacterized protein n=1 Tax=Caerostris extrusa TaxID=172846 RepID=A0AAV4WKT5_CAEEX|nr:hypothetical protein CEXT_637201 [Caerostris extrusa]